MPNLLQFTYFVSSIEDQALEHHPFSQMIIPPTKKTD